MNLSEVLQRLDVGAVVELFVLDTTVIGGTELLRFHDGVTVSGSPLVWQGHTYSPFPVDAEGFESTTKGTLPRPRLRAANIAGSMFALLEAYDDLIGAKVTRKRTAAMFLDGQPTADPNQHLPDDVYYVERKVNANSTVVELELASALDLEGFKLPSRQITVDSCTWGYRSAECSYTGTAYFNTDDQPVATAAEDYCSKRISGCKKRFGQNAVLPIGTFPAAKAYK